MAVARSSGVPHRPIGIRARISRARLASCQRRCVVGCHVSRRDCVDGDVMSGEFVRHRFCQTDDPVLGGGVGHDADAALIGKHRGGMMRPPRARTISAAAACDN